MAFTEFFKIDCSWRAIALGSIPGALFLSRMLSVLFDQIAVVEWVVGGRSCTAKLSLLGGSLFLRVLNGCRIRRFECVPTGQLFALRGGSKRRVSCFNERNFD